MKAAVASPRVTFKNTLLLTDFSEASEAALPFAAAIARAFDAKTFVLHVLMPDPLLYSTPVSAAVAQETQEDAAKAGMKRIESQLAGLPHETVLECGTVVWPIVEQIVKARNVDLIVAGTHGRTGAERLLLGSVAEEIFRRSPVPVLTVGPAVSKGFHGGARFHSILFPTDFSSHSLGALPYAFSLAQENQARLTLLHVLPFARTAVPTVNQASMTAARSKLENVIPDGITNWCRPQVLVEIGETASRILEIARIQQADLIVLGVRDISEHPIMATHLGRANAHRVVAHAECPVMTVRG